MTLCYDGRHDASTLNCLLPIDEREVSTLNGDEKDVPKDSILHEEELYHLCKCADPCMINQFCLGNSLCVEDIWEGINSWLCSRPLEEVRQKSKYHDREDNAALHVACINCIPPKLFVKLLRIFGNIVSAKCSEGRTVLHCACIGGCSF
eukprot:15341320-Ditylum_brightwellii.AAC.1